MSITHHADVQAWLASADPDTTHAYVWWQGRGIALMPLGRLWDAIKADHHPGTPLPPGPIIADLDGHVFYALVPVGTATTWDVPGTEALGDTAYLTIPALNRTASPGPHWLQPPTAPGQLVDPDELQTVLLGGTL